MKRLILHSVAAVIVMAALDATAVDALAQTKSSCNCKPTLRRRTRVARHSPRTRRTSATNASAARATGPNAAVVGPVLATYTLPENQYFRLRMNQTISSETSRHGDRFKATVVTPVYASGVEVVPAGSVVEGRVTSVTPARSRGREGRLAVAFDAIVLPDGTRQPMDGAMTELQDQKSGEVDAENHVTGRSSENRQLAYIGGGGAGGALIGAAVGGGKGAAIGGAIGAGAGVAGVMLTKGHEAGLRSGTEIGMITTQPITFSVRTDRQR